MYSEVLRPGIALGQYPEREHAGKNAFDATLHNALGLLRRCRVTVYLYMSELNPRGREERGTLQEWVQRVLRQAYRTRDAGHV